MTTLWTVVFALIFFALLMASVALHEIGHMVPAKLFGVKVPKYFVGFGKTLWSTRRGETEYGIKLFPLGGFVQLLGMYPPRNPDAKQTRLTRFADEARSVEWDDITDADHGRLLYEKPVWQKVVVMAGGITMNLILCFLLLWGVLGFNGVVRDLTTVDAVSECIVTQKRDDPACLPTDERTPAYQMGLRAGDKIVSVNDQPVGDFRQLSTLIRGNMDRPITVVVERDGVTQTLPTVNSRIMKVRDRFDPRRGVDAGWIGFNPARAKVKGGPAEVLGDMAEMTEASVVALAKFPVLVWNVAADMVTGKPRDVYGPISIVGASAIAGQAATSEASIGDKAAMFAHLLAAINLFLALFNLIPLPPLDGGHIAGALYEGVRRGVARLFGRPDPGHVDTAKMVPVAYAVGGFLLLCGVVLIVADIVSPMKIF